MNIIPEGFKVIDYKNIKKGFYYINKEGKVLNKYGRDITPDDVRINIVCDNGKQTNYSMNRILNHCFNIPIPKKISNKILCEKDKLEGFKVIDYKNIKKDFYYINKEGKVLNKYGVELTKTKINTITLVRDTNKGNSFSINSLLKHHFNNIKENYIVHEDYVLVDYKDVRKNYYYVNILGDIMTKHGNILKKGIHHRVDLSKDNGSHGHYSSTRILINAFGYTPDKLEGYKVIDYKDIRKNYYYINKEECIVVNKYGKIIKSVNKKVLLTIENDIDKCKSYRIFELILNTI